MYFQQSAFISYNTKNPNTLFSTNYLLFRVYVKRSRIFFTDHVLCNIYCEKPIFEKEFTTVRLITCGMLPCCCCFEASFLACCLLFEHFFWLLHFYFCKVEPSRRLWHTIIIGRVLFFSKSKSILCLILVFQVTEDVAAVLSGYEVREIYSVDYVCSE